MIKSSLFYVESPFQLLQVYESIKLNKPQKIKVIIRVNNSPGNNMQCINICKLLEIKDTSYFKCHASIKCLLLIMKLWLYSLRAKYIYIGNQDSQIFTWLSRVINKQKVILFDDGVASINKRTITYAYQRFSIFEHSQIPPANSFHYLASHIKSSKHKKNANIIIGAKVVECGICSITTYEKCLKSMVAHEKLTNPEYPIIYIPHRDEDQSRLEQLKKKFGFEVIQTKLPI